MPEYIYKKAHIDKAKPEDTIIIPHDAIEIQTKYGGHEINGHVVVQWLEPIHLTHDCVPTDGFGTLETFCILETFGISDRVK